MNSVNCNDRSTIFEPQPVKLAQPTSDDALEEVKIELLNDPITPLKKKTNAKELNDDLNSDHFTEDNLLEECKHDLDAAEDAVKDTSKRLNHLLMI